MGARIDCYLDIASFFSYVAFADLIQNLETLEGHGVEVEFHPVLIGGINNLSGNKPPWMLLAKSKYLAIDMHRASSRVSLNGLAPPKDLMSAAMTTSPLRALHYIKENYPRPTFLAAFSFLFARFWTPPNVNLTQDDNLARALAEASDAQGKELFSSADVGKIMAGRESMKVRLKEETQKAVDLGAFGAPWLWVTNSKGKSQPFFGSDRFNHIYRHLELPFQDVALLPPSAKL